MNQNSSKLASDVSRETFSRLSNYVELLEKWNRTINLIGKATTSDIWTRHIEDSLQILPLIPSSTTSIADFGSGGGLPGLVIACALPETTIWLVEKDQRKAAFLTQAASILSLKHVTVMSEKIETIEKKFDCITARALAPLKDLCALAYPRLKQGAICLFPKGENFATEVEKAREEWHFNSQLHTSKTNEKSCLISITELMPKVPEGNA